VCPKDDEVNVKYFEGCKTRFSSYCEASKSKEETRAHHKDNGVKQKLGD
jgi:hypothetical protein